MIEKETRRGFAFGVFADSISKQLVGNRLPKEFTHQLDLDAEAVLRLHLRQLLTDGEAHRARKKIVKKAVDEVRKRISLPTKGQ